MMTPITVFSEGPVSATMASANMMVGKDRTVSNVMTSMRSSQRGPRPASMPSTSPMAMETEMATRETLSATWPPNNTRDNTSRPS